MTPDENRIYDWLMAKNKEHKERARWSRDSFTKENYQLAARSSLVLAGQIKNGEHKK